MRKSCFIILLSLVLCLTSCGAFGGTNKHSEKNDFSVTQDPVSNTENTTTEEPGPGTSNNEGSKETEFIPISVGERIMKEDLCEVYIEYAVITPKVEPLSPKQLYRYYRAEKGSQYYDVCVEYTNLMSISINATVGYSVILRDTEGNGYSGFYAVETDDRGDFTFPNKGGEADTNETVYVHYLFELPDEIANAPEKLVAIIRVWGDFYRLQQSE